MLWEFVFYIENGGKCSNHRDLKGFTNIYITLRINFISFNLSARIFIFRFGEIR